MAVNEEDKHVIKSLIQKKCYGVKKLLKMLLNKGSTLGGLKKLICKIECWHICEICLFEHFAV